MKTKLLVAFFTFLAFFLHASDHQNLRKNIESEWFQDLYPYQTQNLGRSLAKISDNEFTGFVDAVNIHLFKFESIPSLFNTPANDPNSRNALAAANAIIIQSFADLDAAKRNYLSEIALEVCKEMDNYDKPETIEKISEILKHSDNEKIKALIFTIQELGKVMNGFQKKKLFENVVNKSISCLHSLTRLSLKISPLFFSNEHKQILYVRLSSIANEGNIPNFNAVADIDFNMFRIIDEKIKDPNLVINFIIDLINASQAQRIEMLKFN